MTVAELPNPMGEIAKIVSSASVGIAREVFAAITVRDPPRLERASHTPIGIAIAMAIPVASADIHRCSTMRRLMPEEPLQLRGSLSQVNASEKMFTRPHPLGASKV